ncbi:hypothetical protein L198_05539 [Cryptococcus wingfieldii CBS 7118]|uniref:Uncharacterized protein n=1 Tax=Cryptococcus wingfieldii CBS 7118 TaxID=1295528 RepID=A0A1E3IWE0_9TREE|nr:hypothetical protein L198_05539 [Cryptococcus wingfieldii CBS 7118]ODN92745.1 hypothetical protein L198_05539 [Cryptococcus wingfieldii CBS 7118]
MSVSGLTISITYSPFPPDFDLRLREVAREVVSEEWDQRTPKIDPAAPILPPQEPELAEAIRQAGPKGEEREEAFNRHKAPLRLVDNNALAIAKVNDAPQGPPTLPLQVASKQGTFSASHQSPLRIPQAGKSTIVVAHALHVPVPAGQASKNDQYRTYVNKYHQSVKIHPGVITAPSLAVMESAKERSDKLAHKIWLGMTKFDASLIATCKEAPLLRTSVTSRPEWFFVEDPEWWSPLMRTAFWTSFYMDPPVDIQIFRLPGNIRFSHVTTSSQLPPPTTVYRALVDPMFLNEKAFKSWAKFVPNPPKASAKAFASKPSLQSLLEARTDGLCDKVKRHTMVLKDLGSERRLDLLVRRDEDPRSFRALVRRDIWGLRKAE